jgi:hypothetical protein
VDRETLAWAADRIEEVLAEMSAVGKPSSTAA